jgi:dGTPase
MKEDLFNLRDELDRGELLVLSPRATLSRSAIRRQPDKTAAGDHRQNFAIDADRILHSLAYTRYIDKTQVFYLLKNDHITHRVLHVQLVSRIARTIGRHLKLNEDLIEAIALGHDLGHAPFGHDGETFLSALCCDHGIGNFVHAVQSVDFLEHIEKGGRGLNLSLQVLDGILCHDGEIDQSHLAPDPHRTFEKFDNMIIEKKKNPKHPVTPMTTEGCVVRLADTISYIGRDVEDAIRVGIIKRSDLPDQCVRVLGNTNGQIVYKLVTDLIRTSLNNDVVALSPETAAALLNLKNFNREKIYFNQAVKSEAQKIACLFNYLFSHLMEELSGTEPTVPGMRDYLENMDETYLKSRSHAEIVRDFIAGMTDEYFLRLSRQILFPQYRTDGFIMSND